MERALLIKKIIGIVINAFVFVSSMVILISGVVFGYNSFKGTFQGGPNISYIKYFTTLSNAFNGFVALFILVLLIKHFKEDIIYPKWIKLLLLASTTSVALTFLTVLFFLAPTYISYGYSFFYMYQNDMFFLHFFNPLLSFLFFAFLFKGEKINPKECLFALIPMGLYSIVYSINVISGIWEDFYGFTFGGKYYLAIIVLPIMFAVTYLTAFFTNLLSSKINKV